MWQLKMTNAAKGWVEVGTFETVRAAVARIKEIENYPGGLFLESYVDPIVDTDDDVLSVLHHTGKAAEYDIRRAGAI